MRILVLNQDWFTRDLRAAGHTVTTCGISHHLDVQIEVPLSHIDTIIKGLPEEKKPDIIVVLDNSAPMILSGLEACPIPIIFYSVDTHHHGALHLALSNIFDYTLVAQKDYLPLFSEAGLEAHWMPLWASQFVTPVAQKKHGAVFVGTLNPKLNPERVKFFDELRTKVDMLCMTGAFPEIFSTSEIVINQTVKRDLNFRVFESMMCGAMLLTERIDNGLFDLFEDGKHLVTYEKGNVDEAAALLRSFLADPKRCREIAACGREEILRVHLETHRAQRLIEIIKNVKKKTSPVICWSGMMNYAILGRNMAKLDTSLSNRAYLCALRVAEEAINRGEVLTEQLSCYLVLAAHRYDSALRSDAGLRLLQRAREAYPDLLLISLACMRTWLNGGQREKAEELARKISPEDVYATFMHAETAIASLLAEN